MEKPFSDLMLRFPFIDVVIASTADGVPLMRVINPVSTIDIGSEEVEFPVCLAIVAEQTRRLKVGNLSVVLSVYKNRLVMSIYNSFLITTILCHEKNEALLLSLAPQIQGVLNNLALEVENPSC
ncbi:mitogen-activated protein kinase kinase 1 interacting [Blastocystis sp. subtype 4]|uniref:mitogen-activated protein kinase kinase 1 interacting n=1 Tax=Blastocystis sp. subtype 4 TaxID=944170 RepID=UPI0007120F41|nr:mitogen-activated protein kinase kinase 1 interacting [Blastocystis sp. subtype 4]KNB42121.1 mitogen-activated protein kinase kinase 1 interacting [Blastocystis sp. subtype 4]|eukprot:XP_014525564.1 mitogen-activated protein kinase kinase 1 interacting [Blastocystis sp. subtype 4]